MAFFGAVARSAFRVIPDTAIAGDLVGSLLGPVLVAGALSGLGLSALAVRLGRGRFTIVLPLVLSAACLLNQFGVSPAVAEIRLNDPGLAPALAARFSALHQLSVWLFVGTGVGLVALAVAHAIAEARGTRPDGVAVS
jgi:hypothetical protein